MNYNASVPPPPPLPKKNDHPSILLMSLLMLKQATHVFLGTLYCFIGMRIPKSWMFTYANCLEKIETANKWVSVT